MWTRIRYGEDDGAAMGTLRDVGDDGGDEGRWYERWETTGLSLARQERDVASLAEASLPLF
ncbi:hypothetical protein [Paenibacillus oceani]|uniref:Uncharacterized protein n=1 Tax=Paenibacillus oceani TaxID=2772510 RepID=A0A927C469_9BACL|nr:hypothetical protein [Paenibacillus oceani]MBD2861014.1 hypothetical protein [Paenibacillus oceani]